MLDFAAYLHDPPKSKRKGKQNWVHFSFGGVVPMLKRNKDGKTTPCGKTARRIAVSKDVIMVTCPRCIEELKGIDMKF